MPTYEYSPVSGKCRQCNGVFEVVQRMSEPKLKECPTCGKPCERRISLAAVSSGRYSMSKSSIEKSGFTAYKKNADGFYERTAGHKGPKHLRKPPKA
jgi:putative FmdB family regulatory protein